MVIFNSYVSLPEGNGIFSTCKTIGDGSRLNYHLWGNRYPPAMTSGAYAPGVSIVMGIPQELDGNGKSPENMDENRGDPHDLGHLHIIISYNDHLIW